MTKEDVLKNEILLKAGELNFICLRLNSGQAWNGTLVNGVILNPRSIKLCPKGTPDLLFLMQNGQYCFVETKIFPRKATENQLNFIKNVQKRGGIAGVCYSVEDFLQLIGYYT